MSGLSRRQAALLAALLDADGRVVSYGALGDVVGSSGVNDRATLQQYAFRIRRLGILGIEAVANRGYRLTSIPPDWALETVLTMLDVLRRDEREMPLVWRRAS